MHPAFAMTEHGYLGSTIDYIEICTKNGIKPLVGCEIYMATDEAIRLYKETGEAPKRYHMVILCKNFEGYRELVGMNNDAVKSGNTFVSRIKRWYTLITPSLLAKWGRGNWIVLNACLGSYALHPAVFDDDIRETYNRIVWFREQFGEDYYFEFQMLNMDKQRKMNTIQMKFMKEMFPDQKAVITSDSHYVNRDQAIQRDIVMAMNWKIPLGMFHEINAKNENAEEQVDIFFRTDHQLVESWKEGGHDKIISEEAFSKACQNTIAIAEQIEPFDLSRSQDLNTLKRYFDGDVNEILMKACKKGLERRILGKVHDPTIYIERLAREFPIVVEKDFAIYFLALQRVLEKLKEKNVWRGIGRGSGGSFLINYLLGITNIDPIKYNLMSWRFLDSNRCLPMDQIVMTMNGEKMLKDLSSDDLILGNDGYQSIIDRSVTKHQRIVRIRFGNKEIRCSENHRFPIINANGNKQLKFAKDLVEGDKFLSM